MFDVVGRQIVDGILETRGGEGGAGIVTNDPSWSETSRFDVVDFTTERL